MDQQIKENLQNGKNQHDKLYNKNGNMKNNNLLDDTNEIGKNQHDELNRTNDNMKKNDLLDETNEIENEFFPPELLQEEERLKTEHENIDKMSLMEDLDEQARKKRYQNLLVLLENSTKLTNVFENRLKRCKQQIIKKELQKAKKINGILSQNDANLSKITNDSIDNINEDEYYLSLFKQPKLFNGNLKNHQIEGLLWIRTLYENGLNGILADDMGLGKTIQTIAFYCFLIEMGVPGPFLIIAPLSTIPNWLTEFSKFAPQLTTVIYHGCESDRIKIRSKFNTSKKMNDIDLCPVIITTYEVVRVDIKPLKNTRWKYITIDEGHKLKNINTSISKCLRLFDCANKLILTGTPIQNDMTELWSLLNLLMPKLFDKLEDFNSWFVIDDFFNSNDHIANLAKKDEILNIILKILKPFILRREKCETDLKLPPKKEIVIYAPMTEVQHELYKATLNKHMEILLNKEKEKDVIIYGEKTKRKCVESIIKYTDLIAIKHKPDVEVSETSNMAISVVMQNPFMQLKKIANHPYLVHMPLVPNTNQILVDENIIKVSGKFQVLEAMLLKLKLRGHKVLLFSTMTQLLDVIEEFLIFRSYEYSRLDGSMKIEDRVEAITKFFSDSCFVMIISTRAGGLGLNLTAADTVIIFDSDWNPQCDLQAQDRCHRMGQDKPVVVYRLCSKHTVDEKILGRACAKRKLEKIIIGSGSFSRNTKLDISSIEELMSLLASSEYTKTIQSNGLIFTDEELDCLLDRSDMIESRSESETIVSQSAEHFKVISTT